MKSMFVLSACLVLVATVVIAGEARVLRTSLPSGVAPALLGQASDIPMPSPLSPVPDPYYSPSGSPSGQIPLNQYPSSPYSTQSPIVSEPAYGLASPSLELYHNVKYRGVRNISPCAVPTVVQVPDPCNRDASCKTCVNVQICVPPCDPKKVKVTRDGNKVRYDYGKYAVAVKSVGNHVVVHYED